MVAAADLEGFRRKAAANEARSVDFLSTIDVLEEVDSWLECLFACHRFAIERASVSSETKAHHEGYAQLSSVALHVAESARLLLLRGYFGSCLGLIRTLAMHNDLLRDLMLSDDSLRRWLDLRDVTLLDSDAKVRAARLYFRDGSVRKRLREAGEAPLSETLYTVASAAVHGSAEGSRFFLSESLSEPGLHYVGYDVPFNPGRLLNHAVLLLSTLPHLCGFLLEKLNAVKVLDDPGLERLTVRYLARLAEYEERNKGFSYLLARLDEAQDRVSAGEDFAAIIRSWTIETAESD